MKFSAQEEFGLRCLVAIALEGEDGFLTIPEISKCENLSPSNVAKLLSILRRSGFLRSTRGQQGGYSLSRPADEILLSDVLSVLGGRLYDERFCGRHKGAGERCVHKGQCIISPIWRAIQSAVDQVLSQMTLADLIRESMRPAEEAMAQAPAP